MRHSSGQNSAERSETLLNSRPHVPVEDENIINTGDRNMSHRSKEKARNKLLQNGREECSTPPGETLKKLTSKNKVASM